ncbi:MAG: radical SAM protein, partial [Muribaculaceae bacterium]|nr:radical SAM protein [Muribaculaceae bacterium]
AGYRAVGFMDDNFIWNEERTRAICDIMKRHGLVWGCEARVDAITEPIAEMLGSSGCRYIDLGVESFDDRILAYIKKGITSADIYRAIALLKKYKVPVKLNVLIGSCPLETKDTLRHTLREAKRLDVDQVMFNIVSPFPGTEFYTMAKENGWLATPDYVPTDVQRESILNFPELSARDMERILYRNNISFFFSPRLIWRQMKRFRSWGEFTSALRALRIKLWG